MEQQRESLIALYHATGGGGIGDGHWSRVDNWDQNQEEGIQPHPVASFYGVTVDESGAVVRLDLANNGLSGTRQLRFFQRYIHVYMHLLPNPNLLLNTLSHPDVDQYLTIHTLYVHTYIIFTNFHYFKGDIPSHIGNLTSLTELDMSSNSLTGAEEQTYIHISFIVQSVIVISIRMNVYV